jgi:hypothetical protein
LPDSIGKDDILFEIKTKQMKLELKNREILLKGELFANVIADSCTWTIETQRYQDCLENIGMHVPTSFYLLSSNAPRCILLFNNARGIHVMQLSFMIWHFLIRLEITLAKGDDSEPWSEVVKGDQRGIYRADAKDLLVFDDIISAVRITNHLPQIPL